MGCCTSSSETTTDPHTGQPKTKSKFGGAPPGLRRKKNDPFMPGPGEFQSVDGTTGTATMHFVAYGGGNALTLTDRPNTAAAISGDGKEYIEVTLPAGVSPGETIHVKSPDGRLNAIIVPEGLKKGDKFTVEFVSGPPPTADPANQMTSGSDVQVATAVPESEYTASSGTYTAPVYPTDNPSIKK